MIKNIIMFLFITLFQFTFSQESQLVQDEEFPVFPICSLVPSSMQNICFDLQNTEIKTRGRFNYYVRMIFGFFEPPTYLRKDITYRPQCPYINI